MDRKNILLSLTSYDKLTMNQIIEQAVDEYGYKLSNIAIDIYDSCIAQFYDQYEPRIYDRHGDKSGFNLYSAQNMGYGNLIIDMSLTPENLLPYYSMRRLKTGEYVPGKLVSPDRRAKVLASVMKGIRAPKTKRSRKANFPEKWTASYPNEYSQYKEWQSKFHTIDAILDDFCENIVNDTIDIFWNILSSYI